LKKVFLPDPEIKESLNESANTLYEPLNPRPSMMAIFFAVESF